ncbi:MAG: hypothetical protein OES47_13555 [Acidobacteriota bacterium]|nr:hypothetical protein [Acidobacteriota bacterium]
MEREREGRTLRWAIALVVLVVLGVVLLGRGRQVFQPEPLAAWVAVQAEGSDLAVVGKVELEAGTAFDLYAVVEAERRNGEKVYFTEAKRVELAGRELPGSSLKPWRGRTTPRILWFTVEAFPPYSEWSGGPRDGELEYRTVFQPDWPAAWTVPGTIKPSVENYLPGQQDALRQARFGTQRFRVRVEVRSDQSAILPQLVLESWGPEEIGKRSEHFPGVVAALRGSLAEPSAVFGLPQLEPSSETTTEDRRLLREWQSRRLAFSRVTLLKAWLDSMAMAWEDLSWRSVDLNAAAERGGPGDLVRAGERLVWVLEDRGRPGALDYEDLCLDFVRGARVSTLRQVFSGTGLVELAAFEREEGQ